MTAVRRPPWASDLGVFRPAPGRLLFLVALLQEVDPDLIAIDPGQLAAPIGQPRGRQQQEEFLQMQALDRAFDRQLGAGLGNVFHYAVTPPGAVDSHHMRRKAALEYDSISPAPFRRRHGRFPVSKLTSPRLRSMAGSRIDAGWLTGGKSGNRRRHVGGIPFAKCR